MGLTAPATPGTYYYGACVDSVSGEADTTNNCSSAVAVTAGAAPAPGLVVDRPAVSEFAPAAGSSLSLSATVRNQGNGASGSTILRFYRSSDPSITSADTAVGSDPVPGLSASESAGGSVGLTAPATPGTYYYGACVDSVSGEADTTNNCSSAVAVTAGAAPAPGLVVDRPAVSEFAPAAGSSLSLSATVRNQGNGASGSTILRFYRSSDPSITSADTAVGSDPVPGLSASESAGGSVGLTAPATPGTYYYGACVDSVSGEADTTNNCSSAVTVTVGMAPVPDLVVGTPTVSSAALLAGAPLTLSATVRNQGNGASGSTILRFYRSSDPSITSADTAVGSDPVPGLSASESAGASVGLTAPATPGTYYYGACVDSVSGEADTTNNCSSAVTVTAGAAPVPDLVVGTPTVSSASPLAGSSFTLGATVRNDGNGASGSTILRFYRSSDPLITSADTAVGSDPVPGLSASESAGASVGLTAPATPGTYYYGACVDSVSGEADTTNNCSSAVTVTVGMAPAPALVVDPPTVSESAPVTREPLTLNATVRNQGDGSSSPTTLRYYESSDSTITIFDRILATDSVPGLSASQSASNSTPPLAAPATPGTYYYGACVDSVSGEADTTNNCSSAVAVTVTAGDVPAADVVVDAPTVSERAPAQGTSLTLSADVRNQGDGSSSPTTLRYYRSGDSTITTADTAVGSDPVPGLSASESAGASVGLTAPATPGTYYYGACVDSVSGEADTTNNCSSAVAVTVTAGAAPSPDLVVDAPTVSTATPRAGASFTLSATVRNQGNGSSSPTNLHFHYEAALLFSTMAETAAGSDPVSGLSASQSASGSVSLIVPATPGTYYYGACVDAVPGEADTANNCSSIVEIRVAPDLVVEAPTVSSSAPAAGASFTLSATVRNVGNGHSWSTTVRYYRSSDPTITTADAAVGSDPVPYLDALRSARGSIGLIAPATPGTYYYGACVDTDGTESDTTNNCSSAVAVTVAPDLVVDAPTVSEIAQAAGANLALSATVRNEGNSASGSSTLRFYRSSDSTITTADTAVGADPVSGLDASQSADGSVSLAAPSTPGPHYYGACVDSVSGEADTTNNCSVAVALGPDLVLDTPEVSTNTQTVGKQFRVVVAVRNQGNAASASAMLSFYRSTDSTITSSDERIDSRTVSALNASETAYLYSDPRAPSTPGTYYYGACVVSTGDDSDTANNCSPALAIVAGRPDLVLDTLTVSPGSPETGSDFELHIDALHNQGNSWSGFTTMRVYLSGDALVTSTDTELAYDLMAPLEPYSSRDIGTVGPLEAPSTPGTYYYGVCVDGVSGEADTTNNCSVVAVTVRLPDLLILLPTVSDSTPATGEGFTLKATLVNRGSSHSQAASLEYYRSIDETITTADTWVGSGRVNGLEPHAISHQDITLTAPSTSGTYYYGVCTRVGTAYYCTESVAVTAGDAQPSPLILRTECFVFQKQDFVRFTVTARVPLTDLVVSTYRVDGRSNTRHLVERVEVGDLAADSSHTELTSKSFQPHLQRHLTTCTARVEGYASVRPSFDPTAQIIGDPQPQTPADQPSVEPTRFQPLYENTFQLFVDLQYSVESNRQYITCGLGQARPCPFHDHISWWSSLPPHLQRCAFVVCDLRAPEWRE